jgi:hypothetical protein
MGNSVVTSAGVRFVALLTRGSSVPLCDEQQMASTAVGALVLWLLLIARLLWLLLRASIAFSTPRTRP